MYALLLATTVCSSLVASAAASGQRTYLNGVLEPSTKARAAYYKEPAGMDGALHLGRIYTMDGVLKAEGRYADAELQVEQGLFVFYFPDGKVESTGNYENGKKSGVWKRYDRWGQALAEKVYDPTPLENIVYTMAQTMPAYPGGERAMVKYVHEKCGKTKGEVVATFVVEKDGGLSDVKVLGADDRTTEQLVQALEASPRWQAGVNDGVPVRVQMRVPLK